MRLSFPICARLRMPITLTTSRASPERAEELKQSLYEIRSRVQTAAHGQPTLLAVSKYKPASDVLSCYELGQLDFGENYVQELVDKADQLPQDIRWHFIGTLQSNKAKTLASIPNLYAIQTLNSIKAANALNKALPETRTSPLNILLQVNTSGEDAKSGLPPLSPQTEAESELVQLARHVVTECPKLYLQGLMTIGSLSESLTAHERNSDFERLKETRDCLQEALARAGLTADGGRWGVSGRLLLSMGMSSDFEAALKSGSDVVRVGTGIFGARPKKGETPSS
ncbi:hypothetical protein AcV5_008370 [Taiwanofungus camphoratus]|nr:hypothetical protein AcV5_008370 [Antrodia cinnamomea]